LTIAKDGDSITFLGNLWQCSVTLTVNKLKRNLALSLLSHVPEKPKCHGHEYGQRLLGKKCAEPKSAADDKKPRI